MKHSQPGGVRLPAWLQKQKNGSELKNNDRDKTLRILWLVTWVSAKAIQQTMQDFLIDYRHETGMRLCHVILKEKR